MPIKPVFGGASIPGHYQEDANISKLFDALLQEGVTTIDTARLYPGSEEAIGRQPRRQEFTIDTKWESGFVPDTSTGEKIIANGLQSLDRAKVKQFDIFYFHAPDSATTFEEQLEAANEVYKKGAFKRLGLSNYSPEQVQQVYDIAKSKGYVLPTVYQGNYNPLSRKIEADLFPVLRRLGIAFYAYSPIAGGFLTKTAQQLDEGAGRFNDQAVNGMYKKIYDKPSFREALIEWNDIAEKEGISKAELAYRWVGYNSALDEKLGDAVIFGASKLEQVAPTAQGLRKGKLSDDAARRIDAIWQKVQGDAIVDNYQWLQSSK